MLYVVHGTDTHKVADRAQALIATLKKRRPDAMVYSLEEEHLDSALLDELLGAQGLFVEKHIVHIRTSFELKEVQDFLTERLEKFQQSNNVVVLSLGKVLAEHKRHIEKRAEKVEEHTTVSRKTEYNAFILGDALGARNARKLWTEYTLARRANMPPQALHGTLLWAARSMALASRTASPEEAGLKPGVYAKFKRYAVNYSPEELRELLRTLLRLYHDAFRGRHDLDTALERWTLTV